jgi:2-hydroxychromene-2-carboxylate isomerase
MCAPMFEAIWVNAKNLNDPATVAPCCMPRALTPRRCWLTQDAEVKDRLKAVTQEAVDRGVSSARPRFFVGTQMFWGQDRLDFVKEALQ